MRKLFLDLLNLAPKFIEALDEFEKTAKSDSPDAKGKRTPTAFEQALEQMGEERKAAKTANRQAARARGDAYDLLRHALDTRLRPMRDKAQASVRKVMKPFASAKANLKDRRSLLRIDPQREPLLDPETARPAFAQAHGEMAAVIPELELQLGAIHTEFSDLFARKAEHLDPSGRLGAEWEERLTHEIEHALTLAKGSVEQAQALLQSLEPDLAAFAREIAEGQSALPAAADGRGDNLLAGLRHGAALSKADIEALAGAITAPGSPGFAAIASAPRSAGSGNREVRAILDTLSPEEKASAAAEAYVRAIAVHALGDMGYGQIEAMPPLHGTAAACTAILAAIEPGEVHFSAAENDRIVHALTLASQCARPALADSPKYWSRIAAGFAIGSDVRFDPEAVRDYLDLVARLEASGLASIGKSQGGYDLTSFAYHHLGAIAGLRRAVGLTDPGPAIEAWNAYLAKRRALRSEVIERVSAFWRPIFVELIDLPAMGEKDGPHRTRAALMPFAAMDATARHVVLDEVKRLRIHIRRTGNYDMISRVDDEQEIRPRSYSDGGRALRKLEELLEMPDEERALYFADPPEVPSLGAFGDFVAGFDPIRPNQSSDRELALMLVDGKFEEAEHEILRWLALAPPSDLRDAMARANWESMSITGWGNLDPWLADATTTGIGLDLSGHVTSEVRNPGNAVAFEANRYTLELFAESSAEDLREFCRAAVCPWHGEFDDIDVSVAIVGLAPVILALRKFHAEVRFDWSAELKQVHAAVERLAMLWCYVCANRLVDRELSSRGIARAVAFVVGDHDFGVFPSVIHLPRPS